MTSVKLARREKSTMPKISWSHTKVHKRRTRFYQRLFIAKSKYTKAQKESRHCGGLFRQKAHCVRASVIGVNTTLRECSIYRFAIQKSPYPSYLFPLAILSSTLIRRQNIRYTCGTKNRRELVERKQARPDGRFSRTA